jgi:5'-nucleotidase
MIYQRILVLSLVKLLEETDQRRVYTCNGTPTDSIKLAINQLLDRKPDWVVSGINHGANASVSVLYSGTMAAAIEGCLYGINSVGFSLNGFSRTADFSICKKYIRIIMQNLAANPLPAGICLNVNIPSIPENDIKGIKICRQARGNWKEEFVAKGIGSLFLTHDGKLLTVTGFSNGITVWRRE